MSQRFSFGPFLLDTARGTLTRDGAALAVGQRGLRVLQALLEAAGQPVPKAASYAFALAASAASERIAFALYGSGAVSTTRSNISLALF